MTDPSSDRAAPESSGEDERIYVVHPESCTSQIKHSSEKQYCYSKDPGDEHFHLLMVGEIYVETNGEKFCLNCAFRRGDLTRNRLHWKRHE